MAFPKSLDVLVIPKLILNVTKSGIVTAADCIDLEMINLLSHELGFTYTVYSEKIRPYGDLSVGHFTLQENLYNVSSYPYACSTTTFATAKPNYVSNSLAPLRPFAMPVWIAFLLSVVLMTITTFFTFRGRIPFLSVLFDALVSLLGVHRDWRPKSNAQKLLVLNWVVGITFLTLGYAAVVLSFLAAPVREKGITNFDDLLDAISNEKATALTLQEDSMNLLLAGSGSEKLKLIGEHASKQKGVTRGVEGNFLEVIKANVAVIADRSILNRLYGGDEHFISKDSILFFLHVMYDWRENHGSFRLCCMEKLNVAIQRVWGSGLMKKKFSDREFLEKLKIRSRFTKSFSQDENAFQPLSLSSMSGAFYILLFGQFLGVLCLFSELVAKGYFMRKIYIKRDKQ